MTSHARERAKGTNGSAQVQYQGFCVGCNNQNHAMVKNAACSHSSIDVDDAFRNAHLSASNNNRLLVSRREARKGTLSGCSVVHFAIVFTSRTRNVCEVITNHGAGTVSGYSLAEWSLSALGSVCGVGSGGSAGWG